MKTIRSVTSLLLCAMVSIVYLLPLGARGQQSPAGSGSKFLQDAAIAGMNTVAMGNLGQKRLQNAEVMAYAEEVLNAHMAANARLKALAKKKNIRLPDPMTIPINSMQTRADTTTKDSAATAIDSLSTDFDAEYVQMMIDDHKKAIELYENGSAATDRDIKRFAASNLVTLRKHLREGEKLVEDMKRPE